MKDDQPKGQKKESVYGIKMKYDELQVKLKEKDIYIKSLKENLVEAENKITKLHKVNMYVIVISQYKWVILVITRV